MSRRVWEASLLVFSLTLGLTSWAKGAGGVGNQLFKAHYNINVKLKGTAKST